MFGLHSNSAGHVENNSQTIFGLCRTSLYPKALIVFAIFLPSFDLTSFCFILANSHVVCWSFQWFFLFLPWIMGMLKQNCLTSGVHFYREISKLSELLSIHLNICHLVLKHCVYLHVWKLVSLKTMSQQVLTRAPSPTITSFSRWQSSLIIVLLAAIICAKSLNFQMKGTQVVIVSLTSLLSHKCQVSSEFLAPGCIPETTGWMAGDGGEWLGTGSGLVERTDQGRWQQSVYCFFFDGS